MIEQGDELDRCNSDMELIKQMKHHSLVGDLAKAEKIFGQFHEQAEQLLELCRMLNQVAPTNKLKITTKTLASWFELSLPKLLGAARCLCENPTSRVAKDCAWAYIQGECRRFRSRARTRSVERAARLTASPATPQTVWCSFYDDFCQLARQLAYLAHSKFDGQRSLRIAALRQQVAARHQLAALESLYADSALFFEATASSPQSLAAADHFRQRARLHSLGSVQSLTNMAPGAELASFGEPLTDSPRSLDHYHGFGANYRRSHEHQPGPEQGPQAGPCSASAGSISTPLVQGPPSSAGSAGLDLQWPTYAASECADCPSSLGRVSYSPALGASPPPPPPPPPPSLHVHELRSLPGPPVVGRRGVTIDPGVPLVLNERPQLQPIVTSAMTSGRLSARRPAPISTGEPEVGQRQRQLQQQQQPLGPGDQTDQQSSSTGGEPDKWSDSEADAIVRGARETAQMALSMYQFTRGEGDLNTTQDLFTQAELFAEEANELYKEVRCFSYKVSVPEVAGSDAQAAGPPADKLKRPSVPPPTLPTRTGSR